MCQIDHEQASQGTVATDSSLIEDIDTDSILQGKIIISFSENPTCIHMYIYSMF